MQKNIFSCFIWLAVVIVLAIVLFWFFGLRAAPRGAQNVQAGNGGLPSGSAASSTTSNGSDRMVENSAAHYRLAVPVGWYVEKSGGTGLALYPDYDPQAVSTSSPQAGAEPECKIEISALPNKGNLMLGDWLTGHLHQDPTAEIAEASQSPSQVSGRDAIAWTGAMNGVSTTLAYIAGDGAVYEIAPSEVETRDVGPAAAKALAGKQGTRKSICQDALEAVLKNFTVISR